MTKVAVYGFIRIVLRPARARRTGGGALLVLVARRRHRRARRALRADAARPQAAARLSARSRTSASSSSASAWRSPSSANGMAGGRGAGADRRAVPRPQPLAVQEPAVLRRRRGADRDRRARHGAARRPDPPHAAHRAGLPGRLRRDLGAAAAQRLRLGMADVPGDPAQPAAAAMGAEVPGAGGRRAAGAVGGAGRRLLRQGLRHRLPRPAAQRPRPQRRARSTASRSAAMVALRRAVRRSPASCRAWSIDALAPVVHGLRRRAHAGRRRRCRWLSIVPIAESAQLLQRPARARLHRASRRRSRRWSIHRFASRALRRAPAWDCGFPDPSPATQYTAGSFAQPIRRVFGSVVFRAREQVDMPRAGRACAPARLARRRCAISSGTALYAPIGALVGCARRPAQRAAVPDHPPLPQPGLRARWSLLLAGARRYGADPRPRRPGRADAAGAGCWRRC